MFCNCSQTFAPFCFLFGWVGGCCSKTKTNIHISDISALIASTPLASASSPALVTASASAVSSAQHHHQHHLMQQQQIPELGNSLNYKVNMKPGTTAACLNQTPSESKGSNSGCFDQGLVSVVALNAAAGVVTDVVVAVGTDVREWCWWCDMYCSYCWCG